MEWGPGDFGGTEIEIATWGQRAVLSFPLFPLQTRAVLAEREALRGWGILEN